MDIANDPDLENKYGFSGIPARRKMQKCGFEATAAKNDGLRIGRGGRKTRHCRAQLGDVSSFTGRAGAIPIDRTYRIQKVLEVLLQKWYSNSPPECAVRNRWRLSPAIE